MYFFHGELTANAVAYDASLLAIRSRHGFRMEFRCLFGVTGDTGTSDRLNGLYGSISLWDQRRQQTRGQRRLIGAGHVALNAISPIARKANVGKIYRPGLGRWPTVYNEGFSSSRAYMNSVDQPLVVNILRRHRPLDGFPLIVVGIRCVMTQDTELSVAPRLAMGSQHGVTNVAVFDLDCLSSRSSFFVGDEKILDDVVTRVSHVFDDIAIGLFQFGPLEPLHADGTGARGLYGKRVLELIGVDSVPLGFRFTNVFFYRDLVVDCRPSKHQAKIIHLGSVDRFTLFVFDAEGNDRVLSGPGAFDLQYVETDSRELIRPAGKCMRPCYGGSELRSFGLVTANAGSFSLGPARWLLPVLRSTLS